MIQTVIERFREHKWGVHFAVDVSHPNAFTWATVELVLALHKLGVAVSIPIATPHPSIPYHKAIKLTSLMRKKPCDEFHIKWSHFWEHHMRTPLYGQVNVEIMCNNYRYQPKAKHVDLWMRHVQLNGYHKVAVSRFNQHVLEDIGFEATHCPVIPLGYSPEIDTIFPGGSFPSEDSKKSLNILLVTNSHDLYRYGTDIAIRGLADTFSSTDNVVVHIKDYSGTGDQSLIRSWIDEKTTFPEVRWHTDFISKRELLELYGSMDLLLAPFRGEGFSMKILDAMTIGVPVMMPAFGGPMEFARHGNFFELACSEIPVGPCADREDLLLGDDITWCEVDQEALVDALKTAYQKRFLLRSTGERARKAVADQFSWNVIAERWIEVLAGWHDERDERRSIFLAEDEVPLTVLMPTKDRLDVLPETLQAYVEQTVPSSEYELLIINDHGDVEALRGVCESFSSLPIRLINNEGEGGRSPARNLGIAEAKGHLVLFVGDDIVPDPALLEEHLVAHKHRPEREAAYLGYTDWHPALEDTPFMQMLVGEGGHQFNYSDCFDGEEISYHKFYTCNISLKRDFIQKETELLDPIFPYGFEDIEWGYRLHLRGLKLYFLASARGAHRHPVSPSSYIQRQRNMGEDLFRFVLKTPSTDLAKEQWPLLFSLEENRLAGWPGSSTEPINAHATIGNIISVYETAISWLCDSEKNSLMKDQRWKRWLENTHRNLWECANELALREGMAKAWNLCPSEEEKAVSWLLALSMGRVVAPHMLYNQLSAHSSEPQSNIKQNLKGNPLAAYIKNVLGRIPLLQRTFRSVKMYTLAAQGK